jgi:hypothetical protein
MEITHFHTMGDERLALHNILFNPDSQRLITAIMRDDLEMASDTPVQYRCFHGNPDAIGTDKASAKKTSCVAFGRLMQTVREEDPDEDAVPDYNHAECHFKYLATDLTWALTSENVCVATRVCSMLIWMYVCPRLQEAVCNATWKTVAQLYFDGASAVEGYPVKLLPFNKRFERYTRNEPGETTVAPLLVPVQIADREISIYNDIIAWNQCSTTTSS